MNKQRDSWRVNDRDISFYEAHARAYAASTLEIDLAPVQDRFLARVRPGGLILDVGSGSGRDTLAFLKRGFRVEAIEPSAALATLSQKLTGITPRLARVQDVTDEARFDGVWACASLVHIVPHELPIALKRLVRSARPDAPVYFSVKHGQGMRTAKDGRPYTDLDEAALDSLLAQLRDASLADQWLSEGPETTHGHRDLWLNVILVRRLP